MHVGHRGSRPVPGDLDRGSQQALPGPAQSRLRHPLGGHPDWKREAARAVYDRVRHFLDPSAGNVGRLARGQKGRFVATCWTARTYQHFGAPRSAYVADWPDLPDWQRETDAGVFEAVESAFTVR